MTAPVFDHPECEHCLHYAPVRVSGRRGPAGELTGLLSCLPQLVKTVRLARHLSLVAVADEVGCSLTTIHRMEREDRLPSGAVCLELVRWLSTVTDAGCDDGDEDRGDD